MKYSNLFFAFIFIPLLCLQASPGFSEEIYDEAECNYLLSPSSRYHWLELDTPARTAWMRQQNHKLNDSLRKSPNLQAIEQNILQAQSGARPLQILRLQDSREIKFMNQGVTKPYEVHLVSSAGETEVLFSTAQIKKNLSVGIKRLLLSPDEKTLAIVTYAAGSTDDFKILFINLETKEKLSQELSVNRNDQIFWLTNSKLRVQVVVDQKEQFVDYDLPKEMISLAESKEFVASNTEAWTLFKGGKQTVARHPDFSDTIIHMLGVDRILGADQQYVYVVTNENTHGREVFRIPLGNVNEKSELILAFNGWELDSAKIKNGYIFMSGHWGEKRSLRIYKIGHDHLSYNHYTFIPIPEYASLSSFSFDEDPSLVHLVMTGQLVLKNNYTWDLTRSDWVGARPRSEDFLNVDGEEFVSEIVKYKSEGTNGLLETIPMRLTYRKGLSPDGRNAVLMDVYGGFSSSETFYPSFNAEKLNFLKHGGILASPALRGGGEYGLRWYRAGQLKNKPNTYYDLINASKWLQKNNWAKAQNIIITGTSNGGLVVAASALMSPESFGLVIPVNGVHDLFRKEVLNNGWNHEYGSIAKKQMAEVISTYSPLELSSRASEQGATATRFAAVPQPQHKPKFLVVAGANDSRVHPSHSYKLSQSLMDAGYEVQTSIIKNSGHWGRNINYQNIIAWRTNSIMWAQIYDHLSWVY